MRHADVKGLVLLKFNVLNSLHYVHFEHVLLYVSVLHKYIEMIQIVSRYVQKGYVVLYDNSSSSIINV